ncbi:MarR family transcriptional regulator [Costertonia aggregata]|uniref:MarR family transcriptional regulator n=2 Tax=Costertonia aggregata TaxID=343403 RepID=A0A7H9AUZ5_9FLAO|nr:MarR family transcriptional regulator [Costertonia aggregata]
MVDYHLQEAFHKNGLDLTKEQMVVLKKLYEEDGLNQNELASLTFRDKSSLARLLAKMESKKYIVREQNADDKRVNDIYITKTGKLLFEKTRPIIKMVIDIMEDGVSVVEKDMMIAILQKIQYNLAEKTTPITKIV